MRGQRSEGVRSCLLPTALLKTGDALAFGHPTAGASLSQMGEGEPLAQRGFPK